MTTTNQLPIQKIYGKGVMDALTAVGITYEEYKEIQMNAKRKQAVMQGLTTIAKRVFDAVPISEPWTSHKILCEYERASGLRIDLRALEGCLGSLIDSGLVYEPTSGHFRKYPEKPVVTKPKLVDAEYFTPPKTNKETIVAKTSAKTTLVDDNDPLTLINGISSKLRALADDLDAAVLIVGESIEDAKSKSEKLTQLQQLLKGLA